MHWHDFAPRTHHCGNVFNWNHLTFVYFTPEACISTFFFLKKERKAEYHMYKCSLIALLGICYLLHRMVRPENRDSSQASAKITQSNK